MCELEGGQCSDRTGSAWILTALNGGNPTYLTHIEATLCEFSFSRNLDGITLNTRVRRYL